MAKPSKTMQTATERDAVSVQATVKHLNQVELSRRWAISPKTLERWRWLKEGPQYLKIGGRVIYRLEDVEAFEQACLHLRPKPRV